MADVALKVEHIEGWVADHKAKTDEIEDRLDLHSKLVDRLIKWALEGNGDSAETRLKAEECRGSRMDSEMTAMKVCVENAVAPGHIAHIAEEAVKAVVTNAKSRDRTTVAKMKALGPLLAGLAAVIASVVTLIAVFAR